MSLFRSNKRTGTKHIRYKSNPATIRIEDKVCKPSEASLHELRRWASVNSYAVTRDLSPSSQVARQPFLYPWLYSSAIKHHQAPFLSFLPHTGSHSPRWMKGRGKLNNMTFFPSRSSVLSVNSWCVLANSHNSGNCLVIERYSMICKVWLY